MTIDKISDEAATDYQLSRIPGNASPKMELYNDQMGSTDSSPTSSINGSAFVYQKPSFVAATNGHVKTANGGTNGYKVNQGPDAVADAEDIWTTDPGTAVRLRLGRDPETDGMKPESLPTWFKRTVNNFAHLPALKVKRGGVWKTWTYLDYFNDVRTAAKAFIHLGLEPFHAVGIIGFNSPEWFISDIAAIYAGGLAVGIYSTNSPEATQYNAYDSRANILVVDDDKQLQKVLKIRHELPHLRAIIQYSGKPSKGVEDNVYSWAEFMALAKLVPDSVLDERHRRMSPNKCCTIIYTSGTTGNPKGAMLSHDNLIWTSKSAMRTAELNHNPIKSQVVFVSYLPLSHVAAQMTDLYLPISCGGVVWFAEPDALKGTLVNTLREARPTFLCGVPRVWEKIAEKMQGMTKHMNPVKLWINTKAQGVGLKSSQNQNGSTPFGFSLINAVVFRKVRQQLGLDRCLYACSGAAPMSKETQEFFLSYNIPIYDIYGMSESSAPHTMNLPGCIKIGSAGKEFPGVTTKIEKPDGEGNGEICMYGRHVFMGYLGQDAKTRDVLDEQGYLHTGDIGKKDRDGFLMITGRLKELLITAGGENVPPVPIEDMIKEELPIVSTAMVIGDKRKFLSVLLTLKSEINLETGAPLDKLSRISRDWIQEHCGVQVSTVSAALKVTGLEKALEKGLAAVNKRATSRAQCVQKFKVLPEDFSIIGGELGPTLKLKRSFVCEKYSALIESIYEGGNEA
ncbi:Long-chain-fatty-acid--CoA ligase ACSBG2 [Hypsibius exemplaris]|uniref:long-chain-fatty-acid--CoA ligase n=1 Tax=Hypsibius exemplaris TaxID=2072580 RepID=A0A1W0X5N2_HYPEX|nr:Long-chain-fatty-acid--CoA ligase ACSBG2 [Hypsibius exemplaris]